MSLKKWDYLIEELIKENSKWSNLEIPTSFKEKRFVSCFKKYKESKTYKWILFKNTRWVFTKRNKRKRGYWWKNIPFNKCIISIWQGDITTLKCNAIVNACNEYLLGCVYQNKMHW